MRASICSSDKSFICSFSSQNSGSVPYSEIYSFNNFGHFEGYNIDKEFGEHILDELGELEQVPEHLKYYIDTEAYGRDLLINDFCEHNGFVFRNC